MVEAHLNELQAATTNEDVAKKIMNIIESNNIYAFAEFLAEPKVASLRDDPQFIKYYNLLQLFAYGTCEDALTGRDQLPELSESMIHKLRQLTLVSMCSQNRCIAIDNAIKTLHLENLASLQRFFIDAVYDGVVKGRMNAKKGIIEVFSWRNRDVTDAELNAVSTKLNNWVKRCVQMKQKLENMAMEAEKNAVEVETRENEVIAEMKRVQKALEGDEEQQRIQKEAYRRAKIQRGKKPQ